MTQAKQYVKFLISETSIESEGHRIVYGFIGLIRSKPVEVQRIGSLLFMVYQALSFDKTLYTSSHMFSNDMIIDRRYCQ